MTTRFRIPFCEFCSKPLPPAAVRGRPRRFCGDRCRKAAQRRRIVATWRAEQLCRAAGLEAADPSELLLSEYNPAAYAEYQRAATPLEAFLVGDAAATPDDRLLAAVQELPLLAGVFRRLGVDARPAFAWRCEKVADALDKALQAYFPTPEA